MQNPIYEKIGKDYSVSAAEVEAQMNEALQSTGTDITQLLLTLSDVLLRDN